MKAVIARKEVVARDTIMLYLLPEKRISFSPGQFVVLSIPNPKYTDQRGCSRCLSIASAPDEPELGITTRLSGSAFKRCLSELKSRDSLEIKVVGGKFSLPPPDKGIVMIAGGIGVSPFRSMIRMAWKISPKYDITLLYSNRSLKDTAFLEEFRNLAEVNPLFHFGLTLTRERKWKGEKGRIDRDKILRYVKEPAKKYYMIVGPPDMVRDISEVLADMKVPKAQIISENFGRK